MLFSRSKKADRNAAYARPRWVQLQQQTGSSRGRANFQLDWAGLAKNGFITPELMEDDLAREFSFIKRRLFRRLDFFNRGQAGGRQGKDERCPLVLITSGSPGEGKTFSSSNLALSLTLEEQMEVLLIDADLAKPSIPETFGFSEELPGLFDCLVDPQRNLDELILHAGNSKLSILPAGQATVSPAPLLGSDAMLTLLDKVSFGPDAYDFVVMDGPPLLATTEAAVLAPYADEVVLVIGAGDATVSQIRTSLEMLGDQDKISLLMNRMPLSERLPSDYSDSYRLSA